MAFVYTKYCCLECTRSAPDLDILSAVHLQSYLKPVRSEHLQNVKQLVLQVHENSSEGKLTVGYYNPDR